MPSSEDKKPIVIGHCNTCLRETKHFLLHHEKEECVELDGNDDVSFHSVRTHEMLRCCGCDEIIMRIKYRGDDDPEGSVEYFPSAVSRKKPQWMIAYFPSNWRDLQNPFPLFSLINEIYDALYRSNRRLAVMGIRAVIDYVLTEQLGEDSGGFEQKLKEALTKKIITPIDHNILKSCIELGNAASHRMHCADTRVEEGVRS